MSFRPISKYAPSMISRDLICSCINILTSLQPQTPNFENWLKLITNDCVDCFHPAIHDILLIVCPQEIRSLGRSDLHSVLGHLDCLCASIQRHVPSDLITLLVDESRFVCQDEQSWLVDIPLVPLLEHALVDHLACNSHRFCLWTEHVTVKAARDGAIAKDVLSVLLLLLSNLSFKV